MADIKLKDLYLSKEELKDVMQLVAKKRNTKNYKNKSSDRLYKKIQETIQHIIFLKVNQKTSKSPFII